MKGRRGTGGQFPVLVVFPAQSEHGEMKSVCVFLGFFSPKCRLWA